MEHCFFGFRKSGGKRDTRDFTSWSGKFIYKFLTHLIDFRRVTTKVLAYLNKCICISLLQVLKLLAKEAWLPLKVLSLLSKHNNSKATGKTKLFLSTASNFDTFFFLLQLFGCHKIGSKFTLFLNKVKEHHGMGNIFYRLFDLNRYHKQNAFEKSTLRKSRTSCR